MKRESKGWCGNLWSTRIGLPIICYFSDKLKYDNGYLHASILKCLVFTYQGLFPDLAYGGVLYHNFLGLLDDRDVSDNWQY